MLTPSSSRSTLLRALTLPAVAVAGLAACSDDLAGPDDNLFFSPLSASMERLSGTILFMGIVNHPTYPTA